MRAYAQWMGLTLTERRAITEAAATRYQQASKGAKTRILDELCANTGWHRNHARKSLKAALRPKIVTPRGPRPHKYGPGVIAALTECWTVLGMPAGKRLAPMLSELVAVLRYFGELGHRRGQSPDRRVAHPHHQQSLHPGAPAPMNKRARLREATNPPSRAS